MRNRTQGTTTILVLGSCCLVILAATAHLLHDHLDHAKHGKTVADVICAFCAYCASPAGKIGCLPPSFSITHFCGIDSGGIILRSASFLRVQIGRAPPVLVQANCSQAVITNANA